MGYARSFAGKGTIDWTMKDNRVAKITGCVLEKRYDEVFLLLHRRENEKWVAG